MTNRRNDMLYSLSFLSSFYMKLTMDTSGVGGNLLRMKLDFTFVKLAGLKYDISLKLKYGPDRLTNE